MIKKLLLTIFLIIIFARTAVAQEVFKVTSVNFDTSNSIIFLTSPDNTVEPIMKSVKMVKLANPRRIYFDINSAVLVTSPQNWYFNNGVLKQIKMSQFSTAPNKIRVVLYLDEDLDPAKITFLRINNNLVIKLKEIGCKEDYFLNIYRDEHNTSSNFYENLSISNEDLERVKIAVNAKESDVVLNQIQQAFNSSTAPKADIIPSSIKTVDAVKKELKLKSKYYLNMAVPKQNGVLISGFGALSTEKPMYLTNPARVVFDISNAVVNPALRNKEIKINEKESVKIGQFELNKARIVITSDELEKYSPVFSADGQSVLLVKPEGLDVSTLFSKTTDAVSYFHKSLNPLTDEFIIAFNSPVVVGVRRDSSKLAMTFYNALRYNDADFKNSVRTTNLNEMKIDLMPQVGLKLTQPLKKDSVVNCYLGGDGKSIRLTIKNSKAAFVAPKRPTCPGGKGVVLDSGHGGADYGAIRNGINEKDINLDVTKRVEAILLSKGVNVYMTRDRDESVSLQDRTIFCDNKSPDVFVSVHVNSSVKPEITGIETHYYHQESLELAQTVHSNLVSCIRSTDRGLFKSRFYVINHTSVPSILVEIGFISNNAERAELISEQRKQQTAQAIANGILKYLNKK